MKITFLGTSSMVPTKNRNTTAILINHKSETILIDCGEGTQRQLKIKKLSPAKITKILITHWHGDHILGLPGLIQTLSHSDYTKTLEIYGPKDTKKYISNLLNSFQYQENKIKINVTEINSNKTFFENKDFELKSQKTNHSIIGLAYSIIEKDKRKINIDYTKKFGLVKDKILGKLQKGETITFNGKEITPEKGTIIMPGKKISIILDTELTKDLINFSKNSDLIISESTFSKDLKKEAKKSKHMTSEDAANLAKKSKSEKLILTHFSQRYTTTKEIEKEAKKIFKNTIAANDFFTLEV
ncbi:ribonuclease Z [Candidatus Woesearchaeota archaeon]|jgi:ribonuclease Z|nr:ribonuclease Z [Candidatus Woesearchaeota archaeon]MBT4835046.1 ribonuclease Z [Candidatus Woesearchaeota archaeon]MBT6735215.1 ribonuclease Z [Candidatus Woesearchaeota archaeon]MBT7169431.1 ribonuclease Z [Candidatus Woesearchaeota archaeon]MBT7474974.1 ribonuclease Z [Candidatus Woesearchaeota archaeon]